MKAVVRFLFPVLMLLAAFAAVMVAPLLPRVPPEMLALMPGFLFIGVLVLVPPRRDARQPSAVNRRREQNFGIRTANPGGLWDGLRGGKRGRSDVHHGRPG